MELRSENSSQDIILVRAKTAPVLMKQSFDDYSKSLVFDQVEKCISSLNLFVKGTNLQFDIESTEGQLACKAFLHNLEDLINSLECKISNRDYRNEFTKAYRILYIDNKLSYLTEILDSAQECILISSSYIICKWRKI